MSVNVEYNFGQQKIHLFKGKDWPTRILGKCGVKFEMNYHYNSKRVKLSSRVLKIKLPCLDLCRPKVEQLIFIFNIQNTSTSTLTTAWYNTETITYLPRATSSVSVINNSNWLTKCRNKHRNQSPLTYWSLDKMAAISLTTFSNGFSRKKMHEFRLKFHWRLFLRVQIPIFQHWFR